MHGTTIKMHGTTIKMHSTTIKVHGTTIKMHGTTTKMHGTTINMHGTTIQMHGTTIKMHGTTIKMHGTTIKNVYYVVYKIEAKYFHYFKIYKRILRNALFYFTEMEKKGCANATLCVSVCACDTIKEAEYLIVFHDNACEVCAV
jgi:hypothetical protein